MFSDTRNTESISTPPTLPSPLPLSLSPPPIPPFSQDELKQIYPFIFFFIHPHPPTIQPLTRFIYPATHQPPSHPSTSHLATHSLKHPFIQPTIQTPTYPPNHPNTHPNTHPSTQPTPPFYSIPPNHYIPIQLTINMMTRRADVSRRGGVCPGSL